MIARHPIARFWHIIKVCSQTRVADFYCTKIHVVGAAKHIILFYFHRLSVFGVLRSELRKVWQLELILLVSLLLQHLQLLAHLCEVEVRFPIRNIF